MLVYSSDKTTFIDDVRRNVISDRILDAMRRRGQGGVGDRERHSWEQSFQYMKNVLEDEAIPDDAGIAVEYRIPQTSKRVDIIVSGLDENRREACVIVELKQWMSLARYLYRKARVGLQYLTTKAHEAAAGARPNGPIRGY